MRIFALGGYGKVGFPAIQLLVQSDLVTEIAIVGRSLDRAETAAREIGDKAIAVQADGTDEQKLTSLLAGYDIVSNSGKDETVVPAIRAAMRTGTHYCDVNVFVLEQALQLTSEAEAAGITAVVANGIHPSITNLMGVHVARQLDEVEQLQLGDASIYNFQSGRELTPRQWLEDPKESLAALHDYRSSIAWMLQMVQESGSRSVCGYQDDRWGQTDPVRSGLDVPTPRGGTITSYPYGSIDPLFGSLPHDLSRVPPVEMFFSSLPPQLQGVLREQALRVLEGNIDSNTAVSSFYDAVESDPHHWLTLPDDFVAPAKIWARAVGHRQGRAARCSCWLTAPMWGVGGYLLTSVALVAAVRKILRGEIREPGVKTAEKVFEPQSFFDEVIAVLPDPPPDGRLIGESFEWMR